MYYETNKKNLAKKRTRQDGTKTKGKEYIKACQGLR